MTTGTGPKKSQTGAIIELRKKKKNHPKEEREYSGPALADSQRDVNIDVKAIQTSIISA